MPRQAPRTLLLSRGTGEIGNAGEIFLRTLAAHYPADHICRFMYVPRGQSSLPDTWLGFPASSAGIVRQRSYRRLGEHGGRLASLAVSGYARRIDARRLIREATHFGRTHRVEQVWAVLNSPHVIHTARFVAEQLEVPLVLTVWDPPERLADALGLHAWTRATMCEEFERTLRNAVRVAVASDGMREEYKQRYGVESGVLIQGVDTSWVRASADHMVDPRRLIIGFAGSMYASAEFAALINALSGANWRVGSREVTLRVLGRSLRLDTGAGVHIEWLGWRPVLQVIEALSGVDVCYVPYWLDEGHSVAARLCFPNKIPIYLASGRPLFVHARKGTSPVLFTSKYGVGVCCHSNDPQAILTALSSFAEDPTAYAAMARAGGPAIAAELSMSVFLGRFARLMGAPLEALAPAGSVKVAGLV